MSIDHPIERTMTMKTPSVAILLISILASPGLCADNAPDASSPWHVVSRTRLARVSVDSALYEQQGNSHFFVKVQIANLSSDDLFVDLRDYGKVIYPNQWGVLRTDGRRSINERRVVIAPLDEQIAHERDSVGDGRGDDRQPHPLIAQGRVLGQ